MKCVLLARDGMGKERHVGGFPVKTGKGRLPLLEMSVSGIGGDRSFGMPGSL